MTVNDPSDAEFEEDRCVLDAALTKILEEDEALSGDPAEHLAAAEVVRKFHIKYRARLEAQGIDVTLFLREFEEQVKIYGTAVKAEDRAVENYLQAKAKQAEAYAQLTEADIRMLHYLDNMTEADWAAQTPE